MNRSKFQRILQLLTVPVKVLGSKAFLLWTIIAWISYYSISSIWLEEAFGSFISLLRDNILIQIPFLLFLAGAIMNLIRASKGTFQQSRIGYFFWLILPLGVIIFFSGFYLSVTQREQGQRIVGTGDIIDPPWSKEKYSIIDIDPGLRDRLTDIDPGLGIFSHEPKMTVLDRFSQKSEIGAFPPKKLNDTYYHILNLGIAPGVRLLQGKNIKSQGYMILRILTPGSSDYFEIPPYPYKFSVSLEADKTVHSGHRKASEYNLKQPRYNVRVFKGEKIIAEGNSRNGIKLDNLTLHFFEPIYWALVEGVKDPALPVMHAGVVLITFGVPLYFIHLVVRLIKR
jgi:hypothetical protein